MRLTSIATATFFVVFSQMSGAVDACLLNTNENGDLICRRGRETSIVARGFIVNETLEASSVLKRGESQYLIDESYAADKNMIIVPVIDVEGKPHYNRILTFTIDRFNENPKFAQRYYGSEYRLKEARPISGFDWDRVRQEIGTAYENSKPSRRKANVTDIAAPEGYDLTSVTLYGSDGSDQGTRHYKDRSEDGFSAWTTVCIANCWLSDGKAEAL